MSISCEISGLHVGTVNFKYFFSFLILKPRFSKILKISLVEILKPVIFSNKLISNLIVLIFSFSILWISILLISPPQISLINNAALFNPSSIDNGSIPLSNLNFASVSRFSFFDVLLIDLGSKYADSNYIFLVSNSVPDLVPPIIPPNPNTPLSSQITHIPSSNL